MFELTFIVYIKHEVGFYEWIKKQDVAKVNENLPEGIRFTGLLKPVFGDVGKLQVRFKLADMNLTTKLHELTMKPGFLNELQSFIDNNRVLETSLVKELSK